MGKLYKYLPGILFCALIAFLSKQLANFLPINSLTIGIILGMIYSNVIGLQKPLQDGTKYTVKKLLKLGIILLGVELNFVALYQSGINILLLAITVVVIGTVVAPLIAKLLGFNDKLGTMLGIGSSVCGTSAVVAVAPVIEADEDDTALAVAIISLLGAIGVLIFPIIGSAIGFSDVQYGFWSGSSLQGVAHALAAAGARNDIALEMATYVKMTRVVLLAPVTLYLSAKFSSKASDGKRKLNLPVYVLLFIIMGIITSFGVLNFNIGALTMQAWLKKASKELILWAMIAMGLGVNFNKIKDVGAKAVLATVLIFITISITAGVFVTIAF